MNRSVILAADLIGFQRWLRERKGVLIRAKPITYNQNESYLVYFLTSEAKACTVLSAVI